MTTPLQYFQMEAAERLERLTAGLTALKRSPNDQKLIGDLFREAHTLKGAAGVAGLSDVSDLYGKMEDTLGKVRKGVEQASTGMIDALQAATATVRDLVAARADERDHDVISETPRPQEPGPADQVKEQSAPLLIVDDSATVRLMEQNALQSAGYTVDTAANAENALAKVKDESYRLIVVDVEMPGLNGIQLTRKLRGDDRFAETPIIIVTSHAEPEHHRQGLAAGANACIVKGDSLRDNLLAAVASLVGEQHGR